MAAKANTVIELCKTTLPVDTIDQFLSAAAAIISNTTSCTTAKGITSANIDIAEAFLACHLISSSGADDSAKQKKRETFEGWTVEYVTGTYDKSGVLSTSFGVTANSILGGCLAEADKRASMICFLG